MRKRNFQIITRLDKEEYERFKKCVKKSGLSQEAYEAGCAVSIKHWPGDGIDFRDQHLVSSVNTMNVDEWEDTFGRNYRELIEAGANTIMAAHIRLPEYSKALNPELKDEDILPGSLSYELTTTLLRDKMGFNGVVVSDATQMAGFTASMKRKDAVPTSIAAGCDMFLFTICHKEDVQYMLDGVERGIITNDRLNEAVTRILALKASLNLHKKKETGMLVPSLNEARSIIGCDEHIKWAKECADQAVTLVKNKNDIFPLSSSNHKRVLFRILSEKQEMTNHYDELSTLFRELMEKEGFIFTDYADAKVPYANVNQISIEDMVADYDIIIYLTSSNGALRKDNRIKWINGMAGDIPKFASEIPAVMISLHAPYYLMDAPMVSGYINAYSPTKIVVEAVVDKVIGKSAFKGKSPVDAFCGMWDTRL